MLDIIEICAFSRPDIQSRRFIISSENRSLLAYVRVPLSISTIGSREMDMDLLRPHLHHLSLPNLVKHCPSP
jgi:hypothetical protein